MGSPVHGRAHEPRPARSRRGRSRPHFRRSDRRGDPAYPARGEHRRNARPRVRDRDASRRRRCAGVAPADGRPRGAGHQRRTASRARTEEDGAARVYYSPHNSDRFISAVDVLDGKFDPQQIAQKLVLIGVTGVGMVEDKNTPLGSPMPGVEIHAQLLENLFDQTLLRRPLWASRRRGARVPAPRCASRLRDAAMERAQFRVARARLRGGARPRRIPRVSTATAACSTPRCRDPLSRCCS